MSRIREARKRDNRIVPFDSTKIADAIYAAFRSVGEGDQATATELAAAVTHFLEERFAPAVEGGASSREGSEVPSRSPASTHPASAPSRIPDIEDIQDMVETVLIEMGHTRVAKAYILYRQKRAMMRQTVQVRKVAPREPGPSEDEVGGDEAAVLPEVERGVEGVSSWQKSRIAAALIREADLDPAIAEEIASSVENKVIASGISRISTSLLRELVDNELFERGLSAKLVKQAPIAIPKYNLEQIIFGTDRKEAYTFPKTPPEIRNIIANRILEEYALEEVFTSAAADAHREGRLFLHRLSDPIRLVRVLWRLGKPQGAAGAAAGAAADEAPQRGAPAASYLDLGDFFRRLWHLAHFFSEEIRLAGLPYLLLDPGSRGLEPGEKVQAILARLSQMDARPDIALELDLGPEALPWLAGLAELARVRPGRFLLAFRLGEAPAGADAHRVLGAIAELYERGERIEFLPPAAGPPRLGLVATGAKITMNLPRAAFRSARDRRSSLEKEIEEALDLAVKAHLERRRFLERLGANRENPLWDLLGRGVGPHVALEAVEFPIGVLGLNECVKFLTGSEMHQDPGSARLGVEIARAARRKLRREERSLGIRLVLEETANVGPLRALERADRLKHPQMAEVDRGRQPQWGPSYTTGVRLHRMAPVDPLRRVEELAAYLPFVEPAGGLIEEFPELRRSASEILPALLEDSLEPAARGALAGLS